MRLSWGKLWGQVPELRQEHRVLTVGLFDGVAALSVAVDLLDLEILGHISVEKGKVGQRVVGSHFPETVRYDDVVEVQDQEVESWARDCFQTSLVILGAGPPVKESVASTLSEIMESVASMDQSDVPRRVDQGGSITAVPYFHHLQTA